MPVESENESESAFGLIAFFFLSFAGTNLIAFDAAFFDERGNRIAEKGGDTTASLRKAVVTLLIDAYRQVNAVARINDSEQTRNAVSEVNGIIAHYKDVAAQPAKHKGGDEPAPEPDPEASAS